MDRDPVTVLFVAGEGRSGSTLLDIVLSQVDGVFGGGELGSLPPRVLADGACGCRRPLSVCPVWRPVIDRALGPDPRSSAGAMVRSHDRCARAKHLPALLSPWADRFVERRAGDYVDQQARLYRAIRDVSGARVVVDSTGRPSYGTVLGRAPGIDLRALHLVRDPRAVGFSWLRRNLHPLRLARPVARLAFAAARWMAFNLAAEALWRRDGARYTRIRYEDLVRRPAEALGAALAVAGLSDPVLPLMDGRDVPTVANHTVLGNPLRYHRGPLTLRLDQEWATAMRPAHKLLVTALTWPLLARYGYAGLRKAAPAVAHGT